MSKPKLTVALTWQKFEESVLAVFEEALRRLALSTELPRAEELINLLLYWLARQVHLEHLKSTKGTFLFSIMFDSRSQPEPDDEARSVRLRKRPDFNCVLTNPQALDVNSSQLNYYLECKRLGIAEGAWILNENYSEHGIKRFIHVDWQYAKGYKSAAMIGYMQNMPPDDILTEVNTHASARQFPSLRKAAADWATKNVTELSQVSLTRSIKPNQFVLKHLWIDLCHCKYVQPKSKARTKTKKAPKARTTTKETGH